MENKLSKGANLARIVLDMIPNGRILRLMEVCGTHTVEISRMGIRGSIKSKIKLLSGPGCPVCVTTQEDIAYALRLSQRNNVIIATFGDMMRVPVGGESLLTLKAKGYDVRMVYSPEEAVDIARENPLKDVVFLAVGFETTIPGIAIAVQKAYRDGIENFYITEFMKTVPGALRVLCQSKVSKVDGYILPGHVSAIIGEKPYRFIGDEYAIPSVITGFEPNDIWEGIYQLVKKIVSGDTVVGNAYSRVVSPDGNTAAMEVMNDTFEPSDAVWRGFGTIPDTGLKLKEKYRSLSAAERFPEDIPTLQEPAGCLCASVVMGLAEPRECKHFGLDCTPRYPLGPCMVSSEGACAAYYRYGE